MCLTWKGEKNAILSCAETMENGSNVCYSLFVGLPQEYILILVLLSIILLSIPNDYFTHWVFNLCQLLCWLFHMNFLFEFLQNFCDVGFSYFTGRAIPGICVLPPRMHRAASEWSLDAVFQENLNDYWMSQGRQTLDLQLLLLPTMATICRLMNLLMFTEHSLHVRHGALNLWGRYNYFAHFTNEKLRFRETVLWPKITQVASNRNGDSTWIQLTPELIFNNHAILLKGLDRKEK